MTSTTHATPQNSAPASNSASVSNVTAPNSTAPPGCLDLIFLFARGSGQSQYDRDFNAFSTAISARIAKITTKYQILDIGTLPHSDIHYPAISIQNLDGAGVFFSRGKLNKYHNSINAGVSELKNYTSHVLKSCPATKFILAGYSQGAQVVMSALPQLKSDNIIYTATFGDPNLYLPEGIGISPPACRGQDLSSYREYAPDCHMHDGILSARIPYHPIEYERKVGLWCNESDPFCGGKINLADFIGAHTSYFKDGRYEHAAEVIMSKIAKNLKKSIINSANSSQNSPNLNELPIPGSHSGDSNKPQNSPETPVVGTHNLALLIDSTSSMMSGIDFYKAEAVKLAENIFKNHGKVALFEFRDLAHDAFGARKLCDFGCSPSEIQQKINQIQTAGGDDIPESALFAIKTALNDLKWQFAATKSIVILTDAPFHSPDHDGTTIDYVVRRSLEIDPVNIYVLAPPIQSSAYNPLISRTNGQFFALNKQNLSLSTRSILSRPVAKLPLEKYESIPDSSLTFDASASFSPAGIKTYEWDLDFDGVFETTTNTPVVSKTYQDTISGFMQVRVTDNNGLSATMSAHVSIQPKVPSPELHDIKVSHESGKIHVSYQRKNTTAVLAIAEDLPVALSSLDHLVVNYSDFPPANITLIPISDKGIKGQKYQIDLTKFKAPPLKSAINHDSTAASSLSSSSALNHNIIPVPNTGQLPSGHRTDFSKTHSHTRGNLSKKLSSKKKLKTPDTGIPAPSSVSTPYVNAPMHNHANI